MTTAEKLSAVSHDSEERLQWLINHTTDHVLAQFLRNLLEQTIKLDEAYQQLVRELNGKNKALEMPPIDSPKKDWSN